MRVGSLCSGIGGMDLGLERAGYEVVYQSEIDPYACKVLAKNFPGVPNLGDIRRIHEVPPTELICAGFPCQDISCAGRGAGLQGEKSSLWFEVLRIIRLARPRWALIENSPALRTRGMDTIYAGLEAAGYSCWPFVVGASDVGASHRRKRAWIIAHATGQQAGVAGQPWEDGGMGEVTADADRPRKRQSQGAVGEERGWAGHEASNATNASGARRQPGECQEDREVWDETRGKKSERRDLALPNAYGIGCGPQRPQSEGQQGPSGLTPYPPLQRCADAGGQCQSSPSSGRREPDADSQGKLERRLVRVVHGLSSETDRDRRLWGQWPDCPATIEKQKNRRARIRCLGNAVVPAIVEAIGRAIIQVEKETSHA